MSWLTPGTITGMLAGLAALAGLLGKGGLASWLADPATAQTINTVIVGALAIIAGFMRGVGKTPPTV